VIRAVALLLFLGVMWPVAYASEGVNFTRCRDGHDDCNLSLLSDQQRVTIAAFAKGRNLAACAARSSTCDWLRLTPAQIETIHAVRLEEQRANRSKLADIKASARNFAACAHMEPICDAAQLTFQQIITLEQIRTERRAVAAHEADARSARRKQQMKRFGRGLLFFVGELAKAYIEIETEVALGEANAPEPVIISTRRQSPPPTAVVECQTNQQCGYGKKCILPEGSIRLNGICIQPVDDFGQTLVQPQPVTVAPERQKGCVFDLDCKIGFVCIKQNTDLEGLCIKR
jgi:hypothetical protein